MIVQSIAVGGLCNVYPRSSKVSWQAVTRHWRPCLGCGAMQHDAGCEMQGCVALRERSAPAACASLCSTEVGCWLGPRLDTVIAALVLWESLE